MTRAVQCAGFTVLKASCAILLAVPLAAAQMAAPAATPTPAPMINEGRNAAVGFALTLELVANSLANQCTKLGGQISGKIETTRQGWRKRNAPLADAANQYLLLVRAMITRERGEAAGKQFYESQKAEFARQALGATRDSFPNDKPDVDSCEKVVESIAGGAMDFEQEPDYFRFLKEIAGDLAKGKTR